MPGPGNRSGGASLSTFHKIDSTHTTITTAAEITLDQQQSTDMNKDGINWDTLCNDPTIQAKIEEHGIAASSGQSPEVVVLENKEEKSTGVSAEDQQFVSIVYESEYNDGTTTTFCVTIYVGALSDDTGDHKIEANKFTRLKVGLVGTPALKDITIPAACFNTDYINTGSGFTAPVIKEGKKRVTVYLPAAA